MTNAGQGLCGGSATIRHPGCICPSTSYPKEASNLRVTSAWKEYAVGTQLEPLVHTAGRGVGKCRPSTWPSAGSFPGGSFSYVLGQGLDTWSHINGKDDFIWLKRMQRMGGNIYSCKDKSRTERQKSLNKSAKGLNPRSGTYHVWQKQETRWKGELDQGGGDGDAESDRFLTPFWGASQLDLLTDWNRKSGATPGVGSPAWALRAGSYTL